MAGGFCLPAHQSPHRHSRPQREHPGPSQPQTLSPTLSGRPAPPALAPGLTHTPEQPAGRPLLGERCAAASPARAPVPGSARAPAQAAGGCSTEQGCLETEATALAPNSWRPTTKTRCWAVARSAGGPSNGCESCETLEGVREAAQGRQVQVDRERNMGSRRLQQSITSA